jgi:hypothetical protein
MLKPAIPTQLMTAEEFVIWAETQPREAGNFELWDGDVIMTRSPSDSPLDKQSERSHHWDVKGMVFVAFRDAIKRAGLPCHAVLDGASVSLPALNHSLAKRDKQVVPDVLVYCGPKVPRNVLIVANPVIVVEVLSPAHQTSSSPASLKATSSTLPSSITLSLMQTSRWSYTISAARTTPGPRGL